MVLALPDGISARIIHRDRIARLSDGAVAYSTVTRHPRKTHFDTKNLRESRCQFPSLRELRQGYLGSP
jgi:hypothetical protein